MKWNTQWTKTRFSTPNTGTTRIPADGFLSLPKFEPGAKSFPQVLRGNKIQTWDSTSRGKKRWRISIFHRVSPWCKRYVFAALRAYWTDWNYQRPRALLNGRTDLNACKAWQSTGSLQGTRHSMPEVQGRCSSLLYCICLLIKPRRRLKVTDQITNY